MVFKIFIVDDDPVMMERVKSFIIKRYADTEVHAFGTAEAAMLELYRKPELIILDYHLESTGDKTMNGLEAMQHIKQLLPSAPVIYISSNDDPEVAENTIQYGAYDFIIKNESAFHRLEIMINNATGHLTVKRELIRQKIFNWILFGLLTAALLYLLLMKFIG